MTARCEKCGREFDSQELLEAHVHAEHAAGSGHVCTACGMVFDSQEELAAHAKAEHAA